MKVLHYGLILNQPWEISRGLRDIGINSDYILWDMCGQDWLIPGCDINLKMERGINIFKNIHANNILKNIRQRVNITSVLLKVIKDYDIIHFHSHPTLWYTDYLNTKYIDLKLLYALNKGLFVSFWGCDARNVDSEITYPLAPCKICDRVSYDICRRTTQKTIGMARKYCNTIFSNSDHCVENPDMIWSNIAINTVELNSKKIKIPDEYIIDRKEDDFIIYHSFGNSKTRPDVKGTGYIRSTIDRVMSKGYNIKYCFVDNIPNKDLKYIQCQSDLVIDQVCSGWYGVTAVECMSLGKPVISYLRDDILKICPNKDVPIINASPHTLEYVIEQTIHYRDTLSEIGEKSRKYAEQYHDRKVIAQTLSNYYKECG